MVVDRLELPPDKALAIEPASRNGRATIRTPAAGAGGLGLIATAPLRLERIDFTLSPRPGSAGILVARGTEVSLRECTFASAEGNTTAPNRMNARAIELHDGGSAMLDGCRLDLDGFDAITVFDERKAPVGATSIRIRATEVSATYGIALYRFSDAAQVDLEADGLAFRGRSFLKRTNFPEMPAVAARVADSEFHLEDTLCWIGDPDLPRARTAFVWQGADNRFPKGGRGVRVGARREGDGRPMRPLEFFRAPGWVEVEGGGRFPSLAEAFANSDEGDTLLLSGRLECAEELGVDGGRHLQAAPDGEPPIVIAADPLRHAIYLRGKSSLRGIRFARYDAQFGAKPIITLRPDGRNAVVEDCWFEILPTARGSGRGLGIDNGGLATVRRCLFHMPRGTALEVNYVSTDAETARVVVEDCGFFDGGALGTNSRGVPNTSLKVEAARCVVVGDGLWGVGSSWPMQRVHLIFADSLIDCSDAMLRPLGVPREKMMSMFRWSGQRNTYAEGMRGLAARPGRAGKTYEPYAIPSIEALAMTLPHFQDAESRFIAIPASPSRSHGDGPALVALRSVLDPSVSGPALETLRAMEALVRRWSPP